MNAVTSQIVVHVHFDGRSDDIPLDVLFPATPTELTQEYEHNASGAAVVSAAFDRTIKEGLANHYDRPVDEFRDYIVDHSEASGNITVRPKAEFGEFGEFGE
jgi:hypothetical protein